MHADISRVRNSGIPGPDVLFILRANKSEDLAIKNSDNIRLQMSKDAASLFICEAVIRIVKVNFDGLGSVVDAQDNIVLLKH